MAAPLLLGLYGNDNEDGEQHKHRNIMIERLLKLYDDALLFLDRLMGIYQLPRRLILNVIIGKKTPKKVGFPLLHQHD